MKPDARKSVSLLLKKVGERSLKELLVRINTVSTLNGIEDLLAITQNPVDAIIIPKACANDIITADTLISGIESSLNIQSKRIRLIALIETTEAVNQINEVIRSSDRLDGVHLGAEDLTKELSIARTREGSEITYVRTGLLIAAKAHGIDFIDTPFTDYKDMEGLQIDLTNIRQIGIQAKAAIHPCQINAINTAFTPTDEEIEQAWQIVEAFNAMQAQNLGVTSFQGAMIDTPVAERAQNLIDRAKIYNVQ